MHLPRLRLRRRTLLIAVAVAGLALGGWATWRRAARFRMLAQLHAANRNLYQMDLVATSVLSGEGALEKAKYQYSTDGPFLSANQVRALASYHEALERKYDLAARQPWLPVAPDPPPPE